MKQFQIRKSNILDHRLVNIASDQPPLSTGEIRVGVEKFGMSSNNITYAVAGETLGYWQFFKAEDDPDNEWGLFPVWGFGEILESRSDDLTVGERLFGYFPPANSLIMRPAGLNETHFFDGSEHRLKLPKGYNLYQRVDAEAGYDPAHDDLRMLLFPLYVTSFMIWDQLKEHDWYGAEQVVLLSASSKTSLGLAYALEEDKEAPKSIGVTSSNNRSFINDLGIYNHCTSYDDMQVEIAKVPTVIIDMSGNADVLGKLHAHLGRAMKRSLDVGLTHWKGTRKDAAIIRDRREFFFAPARIQKRMKEWGSAEFNARSGRFVVETALKSARWLDLELLYGLEGLPKVYLDLANGSSDPKTGFLVKMKTGS